QLIISINGLEGAYIAASSDPSAEGSFKVVGDVEDMFNYPAYHYYDSIYGGSVWDMIEYNNSLYVSLCTGTPDNKPDDNTMQSFALIRADVDDEGNWSWTSVAGSEENNSRYTFGIDPERTRSGAANLMVYGDYLYIGEYNDEEIALEDIIFSMNCDFVNANLEQSVNLYRMNENEDVELVMGDADEMFPEGSLTGYGSGFDRNENQYIWRMQEFEGKLYISTFDTSSLLHPIGQFTNGDIFKMSNEEWTSQINYIKELLNIAMSKVEQPEEDVQVSSSLTNKQKKSAVSFANAEDAFENIDGTIIKDAIDINEILATLEGMLNEQVSEEFLAQLEQAYNELAPIFEELPETIKAEFEKILSSENIHNIKSFLECGYYLSTADRGFDLYVLDEDMNVETITTNGLGDPYNHGGRVFAVNNSGLSLGTANPFYGTQIWNITKTEDSEVDYDLNEDGLVNVNDVTYAQRVLAEEIAMPEYDNFGDLDGNGKFTVNDITFLQRYLAEDF
ncbi:MAG: dockerin type I repeat-containing protein, partial [Ruminococcus sp.]|nr:dockerin type I repeat-containing protein [Ruminococcus sp.]